MKRITLVLLTAAAASLMAACGGAANSNSGSSSAPAKTAAPTKDDLIALDRKATQAWADHDGAYFERFLSDNFVMYGDNGRVDKAGEIKAVAGHKCEVKSFNIEDAQMQMASPDVAYMVYKITYDGTCDGKKMPDSRAASVFVVKGGEWLGAYHAEVPIMAAAGDKKPDAKPDNKNADTRSNTNASRSSADKTAADALNGLTTGAAMKTSASNAKPASAAPANANTTASNTTETKPANANANTTAQAPAGAMRQMADPLLTNDLVELEKAGWNAWKDKDAKKLGEITTANMFMIDAAGAAYYDQASAQKLWAEPCTITSVDVSDPFGVSITTDIALLLYRGTATGTCGNTKLTPVDGATLAHNEGGSWKAVLITEQLAGK